MEDWFENTILQLFKWLKIAWICSDVSRWKQPFSSQGCAIMKKLCFSWKLLDRKQHCANKQTVFVCRVYTHKVIICNTWWHCKSFPINQNNWTIYSWFLFKDNNNVAKYNNRLLKKLHFYNNHIKVNLNFYFHSKLSCTLSKHSAKITFWIGKYSFVCITTKLNSCYLLLLLQYQITVDLECTAYLNKRIIHELAMICTDSEPLISQTEEL